MQVVPADLRPQAATQLGSTILRAVGGNIAALPIGQLLQATVATVRPGEAVLTVGGQQVSVQPSDGLKAGANLVVRVAVGKTPALELVSRDAATIATPTSGPASRFALVDVISIGADGRALVRLDAQEEVHVASSGLVAGERYVRSVELTSNGLVLRPVADHPRLDEAVATAILRGSNPRELGAIIKPLLTELAAIQVTPTKGAAVEQPELPAAAAAVEAVVRSIVPDNGRPPDAKQLRHLVEDGGLHFESKLAQSVEHLEAGVTANVRPEAPDLKGALLRLLRAAHDVGTATALPMARATIETIETQQAGNVLAQIQGTPYILNVPFPDNGRWQTLHLAVQPERQASSGDRESTDGYRLFMHVPLNDLGETWIDARLSGERFRAVLYLGPSAARDRARAELPDLAAELQAGGLKEVLLDVRSTRDLPNAYRQQRAAMLAGRPESVSVLDVRA
jgi:hypothetical protein